MPSLTKLLLTLVAVTGTLAAPTTTSPDTSPFPTLSKRPDYRPAGGGEDDYCGEANPQYTYGTSTPLASDCKAMIDAYPNPGYWSISASETDYKADRWARLASSGTCAFEVRLGSEKQEKVDFRFGTNDVRFYVTAHTQHGQQDKDGRVGVKSGVWCSRKPEAGSVAVEWRVVHS